MISLSAHCINGAAYLNSNAHSIVGGGPVAFQQWNPYEQHLCGATGSAEEG